MLEKLYHVTFVENISSIGTNGLIPQIGERSLEIGESEDGIYHRTNSANTPTSR